jgi:hypothetical protein
MSAQNSQINRETPQKSPKNRLVRSNIVPLCKDNVGMVDAENHQDRALADNPPHVPQARPVENFWALLAPVLYVK